MNANELVAAMQDTFAPLATIATTNPRLVPEHLVPYASNGRGLVIVRVPVDGRRQEVLTTVRVEGQPGIARLGGLDDADAAFWGVTPEFGMADIAIPALLNRLHAHVRATLARTPDHRGMAIAA